jgi:hypothetical protein
MDLQAVKTSLTKWKKSLLEAIADTRKGLQEKLGLMIQTQKMKILVQAS